MRDYGRIQVSENLYLHIFYALVIFFSIVIAPWCSGITTAQLHSVKPELSFCAASNSASGLSEIWDGENL